MLDDFGEQVLQCPLFRIQCQGHGGLLAHVTIGVGRLESRRNQEEAIACGISNNVDIGAVLGQVARFGFLVQLALQNAKELQNL